MRYIVAIEVYRRRGDRTTFESRAIYIVRDKIDLDKSETGI